MQQGWIIAFITIVIIVTHGYAEDLQVSVIPISLDFSEKQNVEVILNYKNTGSDTVYIYNWYLPNHELLDPLFNITRDGNQVEYVGPLIKRKAATVEDMITVKPGMNVSTHVNLSLVYNMTQTGNYTVQFKAHDGFTLLKSSRKRRADNTSSIVVNGGILQSTPTKLFAVGRRNAIIEKSAQINAEARAATLSYSGCRSDQRNSIAAALKSAASYSGSAIQYLSTLRSGGTIRYITWFGTYSAWNKNTLKSNFDNINTVLTSQYMTFDCSCGQPGTYAYVYPSRPYTIYLCDLFWSSPLTGTDSKGGTIIHETSHFSNVVGTDDNVYGQYACQALARSSPYQALNNADSHQYFAENNPRLQ